MVMQVPLPEILFMSKEKIELIHDYAVRSHRIFGQFIYGKFLDSLIIGIIFFGFQRGGDLF